MSLLNDSRLCKIYSEYEICNNATCKGRVLSDGMGLNQCYIDWKNPLPRSRIGYLMCFHFYELEPSSRRSIRCGMPKASKRDCEGKQCCCCPHFLRPSSSGENPLQKRQNALSDSHPFWKGKVPNTKKGGKRVIPPPPTHNFANALLSTSQTK